MEDGRRSGAVYRRIIGEPIRNRISVETGYLDDNFMSDTPHSLLPLSALTPPLIRFRFLRSTTASLFGLLLIFYMLNREDPLRFRSSPFECRAHQATRLSTSLV